MRKIKILTAGPIRSMGMIHGPILTPYTVDDAKLRSLIREGLDIVEILPDKSEKKLTLNDVISSPKKPENDHGQRHNDKKNNQPASTPVPAVEPVEDAPITEDDATEEVESEQSNDVKHQNHPKVNRPNKYKNNK